MVSDYAAFLASKAPQSSASGLTIESDAINETLFDFQRDVTALLTILVCAALGSGLWMLAEAVVDALLFAME